MERTKSSPNLRLRSAASTMALTAAQSAAQNARAFAEETTRQTIAILPEVLPEEVTDLAVTVAASADTFHRSAIRVASHARLVAVDTRRRTLGFIPDPVRSRAASIWAPEAADNFNMMARRAASRSVIFAEAIPLRRTFSGVQQRASDTVAAIFPQWAVDALGRAGTSTLNLAARHTPCAVQCWLANFWHTMGRCIDMRHEVKEWIDSVAEEAHEVWEEIQNPDLNEDELE